MKGFKDYSLSIGLVVLGIVSLAVFQNCSSELTYVEREDGSQAFTNREFGPNSLVLGTSDVIIQLNEIPRDQLIDEGDATVDYSVYAPNGQITSSQCFFNGSELPCETIDRFTLSNQRLGENTFTIVATNDRNQTARETIRWGVFQDLVLVQKDFEVPVAPGDQIDIIINVDNSGSMEYEQSSMANRISSFMDRFADMDYHIAVTTTSPIGSETVWKSSLDYVDGKFVELENGVYCIKKAQYDKTQAQQLIRANVVRGLVLLDEGGQPVINPETNQPYPEGNGWERGIFTTFRSFERAGNPNSAEADCLRPNVPKHVVLISDENETLVDDGGSPLAEQSQSIPQELIELVQSQYGEDIVFKFHSIIVNPYTSEGESCLSSHGGRVGSEYARMSVETGGVIASVCAVDYAAQLGNIGQQIANSNLSYPIGCRAQRKDGETGTLISLETNDPVNIDYGFTGDKLQLSGPLPPGDYRVSFYCYQ
ncbi:MAG: hypothetical protein AAF203_02370 [Pseudomonadota bacterium]